MPRALARGASLTSIEPENNRTEHDTQKYDEIGGRVAKYDSMVRTHHNEPKTNSCANDAGGG